MKAACGGRIVLLTIAKITYSVEQVIQVCCSTEKMWKKEGETLLSLLNLDIKEDKQQLLHNISFKHIDQATSVPIEQYFTIWLRLHLRLIYTTLQLEKRWLFNFSTNPVLLKTWSELAFLPVNSEGHRTAFERVNCFIVVTPCSFAFPLQDYAT